MSVLEIIVLAVVVAAIAFALFVFLPRMRAQAREKKQDRELRKRREQVASEHRTEAESRERQAEVAERRARIAEQEARRERAEAQLRQERAALHERGMADHELIEDREREEFAGTAVGEQDSTPSNGDGGSERPRTSAYQEGRRSVRDPSREEDFQQGRKDEQAGDDRGFLGRLRRDKSNEPAGRR